MSRWIDADEIENAKFQEENLRGMGEHIAYRVGWNEAIESILENAPSIDIVRCSECVYCNVQNTKYLYAICERHGIEFKPFEDDTRTHGCAWGISRSEKPNNSTISKMEQVGKE